MKQLIALILCLTIILTGCSFSGNDSVSEASEEIITIDPIENLEITYTGLNDERLLRTVENLVYRDTIISINSENYVVENVQAVYISKEYIDEMMFNSQQNVFFGYTLEELDDIFQGTKYVFSLGNDGKTAVTEMHEIEPFEWETILKNVAIGTGVILVCVVISAVSNGLGAPAVSMIFAAGAKEAAIVAPSSALIGGLSSGIINYFESGDMEDALKKAAVDASETFKWAAIAATITGGGKEAFALKRATAGGLTMNEAAIIQKESTIPMDVISEFHSMSEYEVYKQSNLKPFLVDGKIALIQDIDLNYVSELPDGTKVTNLVRMQRGLAPLDTTGKAYELHHIGQKADGTIAVLTKKVHDDNAAILNIAGKESEIDRIEFGSVRRSFWKYLGNMFAEGVS